MPAQKKKTTKTTARKSASSTKKAPSRRNKKAPARKPFRRELGGALCGLLALCLIVGLTPTEALFITHFTKLVRGLFGYGVWMAVPALLLAGYNLVFHHGRPVRLRTASTLLLPLLTGSLVHIILSDFSFDGWTGFIKTLWTSGIESASGGVISGAIAVGLEALFAAVVSVVILALAMFAFILMALNLTPAGIIASLKNRERLEYEVEEEEEEEYPLPRHPVTAAPAKPKPRIDIPLEHETPAAAVEQPPVNEKRSGFFSHKSDKVKAPDELFAPASEPTQEVQRAAEQTKADIEAQKISASEVAAATIEVATEIATELEEPVAEYSYPPITLLEEGSGASGDFGAELRNNARRLADTLRSFGVEAAPGDVIRGPSVTRYEFMLDQGVKLSKVTNLSDDIALALGTSGVRIAPIPDKISVVGIEVPNKQVTAVRIRDVLESNDFVGHKSSVAFAVGKDIGGHNIVGNIAKLPHVLIAGTTGSGKSVCTNSLIVSLLYKSTPDEVRFIMVDPKMVELAPYNGIPHLLIPVVTDPKKAAGALQWAVFEMMKRYKLFSEHNVKDLAGYNALAGTDEELKKMPSVVIVIDELADLMLVAAKEVEESICRVAQMGRAAGMHLVIATQRPSADVITGLMKANIPSRISFAVASGMESRIILDTTGAEKLVGRGDMLYAPLGEGKPNRVQGCFISTEEIERVVNFVKANGETHYSDEVIKKIEENVAEREKGKGGAAAAPAAESSEDDGDELLPAAIEVVLETGQASVSMLQRRLKLGYSRAARLVDQMEERGVVGPFEGSKPRQLLITRAQWQEMQLRGGEMSVADVEGAMNEQE